MAVGSGVGVAVGCGVGVGVAVGAGVAVDWGMGVAVGTGVSDGNETVAGSSVSAHAANKPAARNNATQYDTSGRLDGLRAGFADQEDNRVLSLINREFRFIAPREGRVEVTVEQRGMGQARRRPSTCTVSPQHLYSGGIV